tara:strand:+ start:190 stop:459 length:270 start_codon:yes stop_codon:yes gene_type:complete
MSSMKVDAISDTAGTGSPSFPNGISLDSADVENTLTAATVAVTTLDLGDWTIVQSGTDLVFRHGTTNRFKLSTAGALTVEGDVTAFGDA